ncbi:uncharacterized protein LOC119590996 [Penaeus monodon]|uniref:uncharacterized protein LOC119590996 n=1 Tax=Penaeus monodon TaxID=6687 RepID=UPI0018A6E114|nr:uncharacterized protein LOC119590996 [Penaeus monodon]
MKFCGILLFSALAGGLDAHRLPMSTGHFYGNQEGDALTKAESVSDTERGITKTGLHGLLANTGQLRGSVDTESVSGEHSRGAYLGDLAGKGGMWSSAQSSAGLGTLGSKTMLKGFVQDDGAISGSVGTDAHYHGDPYLVPYSMPYPGPESHQRW